MPKCFTPDAISLAKLIHRRGHRRRLQPRLMAGILAYVVAVAVLLLPALLRLLKARTTEKRSVLHPPAP